MEYISVKQAAEQWDLTPRMVVCHCTYNRIKDAKKLSGVWLIPKDASKPEDGRRRDGRRPSAGKQKN